MKICFFGSYDENYSKNVVLLKGLEEEKIEVVHCFHPNYFSLSHYAILTYQFLRKGRDCDIIFVAFFGHYDVLFAWLLAKIFRKKLIFDPLISVYNTRIEDRKYFKKNSFRAKFYIFLDTFNLFLADHVFLDTYQHLKYFKRNFHLLSKKASIVRVGADDKVLKPGSAKTNNTRDLLFYGSYQPSQGVNKIIVAANILKKEKFTWTFIGKGQERPKIEKYAKEHKLSNVTFIDTMSFEDLTSFIKNASIVFGVFGNTIKTNMVIHNKIFQAIAMGRVVITQNTPAVREILTNGYDVVLVSPNAKAIANVLLNLKNNKVKMNYISKNARKTFATNFTTARVGKQAKEAFKLVLSASSKNLQ